MKRSLSLFIAILMVLSSVAAMSLTVGAETACPEFGFAGVQTGENALRLIGWTESTECDAIGFEVTAIAGETVKEKTLETKTVFTSLKSGEQTVAATKLSEKEAPVTVYHDYLYGYSINNIADGQYIFKIVPVAKVGDLYVTATMAIIAVAVEDGDVEVAKLESEKEAVKNAAYDLNGGSEFDAGVAGIFDGNWGTKLCASFRSPLTITWEFDTAEVLSKYIIVSGNDSTDHPGRAPKAWIIYGSNDGETWGIVDEVTDNTFGENNKTPFEFATNNSSEYKYYKMVITENNGQEHIQFQELIPFVYVGDEVEQQVSFDLDTIESSENIAGKACQVLDDNFGTKVCEVGVTTWWVSVKLTEPVAVNRYKMGSGNDAVNRDPKAWKVYGSTDGENWVELDAQTRDSVFDFRTNLYTYDFDNTTAYSYYKLEVLENMGTDEFGLNIAQLCEWQLFVVE